MIRILYIEEFINDFNKDKTFKENSLTNVILEFISGAFRAIDDDLVYLQNDVDIGKCSNQDIFDQIQDIRNNYRRKIY